MEPRSKAERVYGHLRDAIVRLELLPGAPINTVEICEGLGISRQPVSAALARLGRDGLVEIEPQRGSFVARIRLSTVAECAFLRKAIEVACVREIVPKIGDAILETLARNLRYQKAAVDAEDRNGFYELDVAFHNILLDTLGFGRTASVIDASRAQLERVRRLVLPRPGRIMTTYGEHVAISRALEARDADAAADAMRDHLDAAMAEVNEFAASNAALFE